MSTWIKQWLVLGLVVAITGCQLLQDNNPLEQTPVAQLPPKAAPAQSASNQVKPDQPEAEPEQPKSPPAADPKQVDRKIASSYVKKAKAQPASKKSVKPSQNSAYVSLIKQGVSKLRSQNTAAAKALFMQAQGISPNSPVAYLYLSEIAIREKKPADAEGLARRGLLSARSSKLTKGLWKMIQISAKMRGDTQLAEQAANMANR